MTGSFCSNCGTERAPGASFCPTCGNALGAPQEQGPAAQEPTAWSAPQPSAEYVAPQPQHPPVPPVQHPPVPAVQQPAYPAPQPAPPAAQQYPAQQYPAQQYPAQQYPAQQYPSQQYPSQPYAPQQQPYPAQQAPYPEQPWAGSAPYASPPAQPAPAPWSAAPTGMPGPVGQPGRSVIDTLLTGDWGGAARTAGLAVGAMLALSLVGMLLITEGGVGFGETVALLFAGVCLAVGGDAYAEADVDSFGSSFSMGLLPLTVTLVGLGVLAWSFARQLRAAPSARATDALLHGVRTVLVFTVCFLPLSLLTRYTTEDGAVIGLVGRLGVGVFSSVSGALLFAVAALGLTWLLHRSTVLPARVSAFRDKARAPLVGALVVFAVGLLAVLTGLVYGLVEGDDPLVQIGTVLLTAGNGALAAVLWSAGVPLNVEGTASSSVVGEFTPSGSQTIDLFTFTDVSGWFWLAPVVLLGSLVLVSTALVVRQNTIEDARREGLRFAGALAVVAFLATLLLRIAVDGEAAGGEFEFQAEAAADGSLMFNPLFAAVVLGVWGAATGLLAPVVGAKIGAGFVTSVRNRFGSAAAPTSPVQY